MKTVGTPLRVAAATVCVAALHSTLASHAAKAVAEAALGTRRRNALYRPVYNAVALLTFGWLFLYARSLPGRTLYKVEGAAAAGMRLGQLASLVMLAWSAAVVGVLDFAGLTNAWRWVRGHAHIPREPEAQGPRPTTDGDAINARGPFRLVRQAPNFFLAPVLWLNPRMTDQLASFSVVATVYLYLGSIHSERRLRRAYGQPYRGYQQDGPRMFVPQVLTTGANTPLEDVADAVDVVVDGLPRPAR